MSEKSFHKISPKWNTVTRVPPPTPTTPNSLISLHDLRFHTSPTSFFYYSSVNSIAEEQKGQLQIPEVKSRGNSQSVVLLHENKMNPKLVLEKNKTKFSHSDNAVSFSQSPLLSPFLTPATSLLTFDRRVGNEKIRSASLDSKKENGNRNKSPSAGLKSIIKNPTSVMNTKEEKGVSFPSSPNQSPTISLITLRLDKIYPKSSVIPTLKVRGLPDIKKFEKHRKGKSPAKKSGEVKITISEGKSNEKTSLQSLHSSPMSRRKKSSVSSPTLRSVSPRSDTSTNTTPHKYVRLPPHLESICKHATSLFRDHSADSIELKDLNSCWPHLEAIYRDAGARIRLDSNMRPRCMSCPGRKKDILACPAFMHFSITKKDLKLPRDPKSRRKSSFDDETSPSPCSPTKRSVDRSSSPRFTRHTKDSADAVHVNACDRSASDSISNDKEEFSKSNSDREEGGSIEMKDQNLSRERSVRFSMGTLTGNEEHVKPIRSPKEKYGKFSSFFRKKRPGSASESPKNYHDMDSSEEPVNAPSQKRHNLFRKQQPTLLRKIKNSETSTDSCTRLKKEEKSSNSAKKDGHREKEYRTNECFSAEVPSGRRIQFKRSTELMDDQYEKDIAIGASSNSLYKNKKPSKHSQMLLGERKDVNEMPSHTISSDDVLNFTSKRKFPVSSNSDLKSTTPSSSNYSVNESSTIVSSSTDSETTFENQSKKSSIVKTDISSRENSVSGQPMFAGTRKRSLANQIKHIFKDNKSKSLEAMKFVDRGSSPVGFQSEGLLTSCPSSAKTKSTRNSSTEVNKVMGVSKSQQTVPCVNLQYARFQSEIEANDAESNKGSSSSSLKPTILIPKKHSQKTSQIQRKTTGKNNMSCDTGKSENKNSSLGKTDLETSIQKSNLEKSKFSQNKKSMNDFLHQKMVSSSDLNDTMCEVRDKKMSEKSEESTRKSFNSPKKEKLSATITRDKRQSVTKIKPTVIKQKPTPVSFEKSQKSTPLLFEKSQKSTPLSFEKSPKKDISCGTVRKEDLDAKSTSDIQNSLRKEKSVKCDELRGKMSLNNVNERQPLQKVTLKDKEARVEPEVKSRYTSSTEITDNLFNNDMTISGGKGKNTASKVSFSFQNSSADTKVKTGHIVGSQRPYVNSRKQDSVAELLKESPTPCSEKGQPIPPSVPFQVKRSNLETKQKSGNTAVIQLEGENLKKTTPIIGILKDSKGNLVSSNERQKASNVSCAAKRNSPETKMKPGNNGSIQKEENYFKNANSFSTVEASKDKTILNGVNGRQVSKITSSNKSSCKFKSNSSSTMQVEDYVLNKPNQVSNYKITTSGRQTSSKVSFSDNGNTVETKMSSESCSSTNLKDSLSKKRDATTATETWEEKASFSKRQTPSRVSFLLKYNNVESKPKTLNPSPANDNSLNDQNSLVADDTLEVKRSVSGTKAHFTQPKYPGKAQGTDGKNKLKTALSKKGGESFSKPTKKVLKPQNALNTNSQKLNTRNTSTKKSQSLVSKVSSYHEHDNYDVTKRPRSISADSVLTRTSKTNGDSKSSRGPRLLGSETINGSVVPNQPSTYTVNSCFMPAYEVWPGYQGHGQANETVPPYYCDTCRGIVCLHKNEDVQYLDEVYYAVPVKLPFAGKTLRFKDDSERHVESGGSYDSLDDGQTYYVKTNGDKRMYLPRTEWVDSNESDRSSYEYQNGRYFIPNYAVDTPLYDASRNGTPVDEHAHPEEWYEENSVHASFPIAPCPAFPVGTTSFTHMHDFSNEHL